MGLMPEPLNVHAVRDEQSLRIFLDGLEEQLRSLGSTLAELSFIQYQTKRRPDGMAEAEGIQAGIMTNPDYEAVAARFVGQVSDPLLERRLQVLLQAFRGARVSAHPDVRSLVNEISDAIVAQRYDVLGQELDLGAVRHVLRTEANRDRRKAAWLAFGPLSRRLDARTRELFCLRNALAKTAGFENYVHMQLDSQGLTLQQVRGTLEELTLASEPAYRDLLSEGATRQKLGRVQPWDIKYLLDGVGGLPGKYFPRGGIAARLDEWAAHHGLDLKALGISAHMLDIPYNGLCLAVTPRDIRMLGNWSDGHNYYKTAFHELGHALHAAFSDPGSYVLRREPAVFNEAMAELIGYTVQDPAWLAHAGLTPSEVHSAATNAMGPWFAYLRQRTAHALFEFEAYANPDADLDVINAGLEARVLGCSMDEAPRWAAEPNAWYSRYPVYWQNYVLADVVASQIHHDLRRRFGAVWRNARALEYVREQYWAPGGALDWQEKLHRGTGEGLSSRALVSDLSHR